MPDKEFISILHNCIQEEFIAVSEVKENMIRVRFINGHFNVIVT